MSNYTIVATEQEVKIVEFDELGEIPNPTGERKYTQVVYQAKVESKEDLKYQLIKAVEFYNLALDSLYPRIDEFTPKCLKNRKSRI